MWLFPRCGEEAVGYSLYHRQSAWGGDVPQNLCLLTSNSWRFSSLQCCFRVAVGAGGRGTLAPFWWICFCGAFFVCVIVRMYWQPSKISSYWGVELVFRRTGAGVWFVSMSFKSLKEFGVSAERLGSLCKRWMARVQRSVKTSFYIIASLPISCLLWCYRVLDMSLCTPC